MTDILESGARGIRNNNPGNIRKSSTQWAGQAAVQDDPEFVKFTSPEYGIRAMAKIFKSYLGRGLNTLAMMVSTWAPPTENNTGAYIAAVSRETGLQPNALISQADFYKLIPALIRHENGSQPYSSDVISRGVSMS